MYPYKILIIDDNRAVLKSLRLVLSGVFKAVAAVPDPHLIPALLAAGDVDAVLLDMNFDSRRLDGEEGLFWLSNIGEHPNPPAVVLITAFGDIDLAMRSVKQGAEDFVTKPWDNDALIQKLVGAIEKHRQRLKTESLASRAFSLESEISKSRSLSLLELERLHITDVVAQENGNLASSAERLGISRQTLYNKLKKYGILS